MTERVVEGNRRFPVQLYNNREAMSLPWITVFVCQNSGNLLASSRRTFEESGGKATDKTGLTTNHGVARSNHAGRIRNINDLTQTVGSADFRL